MVVKIGGQNWWSKLVVKIGGRNEQKSIRCSKIGYKIVKIGRQMAQKLAQKSVQNSPIKVKIGGQNW